MKQVSTLHTYKTTAKITVRISQGPLMQKVYLNGADHSGRVVYGMNRLRPLERWDRGFETH
jgi:hypothetical protein